MAIGFRPKYEQTIELEGCSTDELMLLAAEAAKTLKWEVSCVRQDKTEFYTPTSVKSWQEKITLYPVDGSPNQLRAVSVCVSMQWFDWGKNRQNLEKLLSTMRNLQSACCFAHAECGDAAAGRSFSYTLEEKPDVDVLAMDESGHASLWALLCFRKGNVATPLLVYLNVAVFVVMAICGVSLFMPTGLSVLQWGADFGPLTLTGDWWRTITCNFIHIGLLHILMNMYALLYIGIFLEQLIGTRRLITAYLLTGLFSALASLVIHPDTVSAGASGSIFGLYGIFLSYLIFHRKIEKGQRKSLLYSIGFFVVYNLLVGAREEGVDNAAHIGGLLSGIVLGSVYWLIDRYASRQRAGYIVTGAEVMAVIVFALVFAGQAVCVPMEFEEIRTLWEDGTLERYVEEENAQEGNNDGESVAPYASESQEEESSAAFTGTDTRLENGMRKYVNKACGFSCTYPPLRWMAVAKSDAGQILQLSGQGINTVTVSYLQPSSEEEKEHIRDLFFKSMSEAASEEVVINGKTFTKLSEVKEYPLAGGGSVEINQSLFFHLDSQKLSGYVVVVMTSDEEYESEAQDILGSIQLH